MNAICVQRTANLLFGALTLSLTIGCVSAPVCREIAAADSGTCSSVFLHRGRPDNATRFQENSAAEWLQRRLDSIAATPVNPESSGEFRGHTWFEKAEKKGGYKEGRWAEDAEPFRDSISSESLEALTDLALTFIEKYPPSQYSYVALGRSPTPLMAFFKAVGIGDAATVPLSKLKYAKFPKETQQEKLKYIQDHIRQFIPTAPLSEGKKVVVIDFVDFGESLAMGAYQIELAIRAMGFTNSVHRVGLIDTTTPTAVSASRKFGFERIDLSEKMASDLYTKKFKPWSLYGEWSVEKLNTQNSIPDSVKRPEFNELVKLLANHIRQNRNVIEILSAYLPPE